VPVVQASVVSLQPCPGQGLLPVKQAPALQNSAPLQKRPSLHWTLPVHCTQLSKISLQKRSGAQAIGVPAWQEPAAEQA